MDAWHELRVSRTAKSGILQVDSQKPVEGIAEVFYSFIYFYQRASLDLFRLSEVGSSSGKSLSHFTAIIIFTSPTNMCECRRTALL